MRFNYRGLACDVDFTAYVPSTWLQPPEYPEIANLTWEIEDLEEVLCWLELDVSEHVEDMVRTVFRLTGKVPQSITDKINSRIEDIDRAACEEWAT